MGNFDTPIRLGIVGCGAVTRNCHLPALQDVPELKVTVLCDRMEKFTHVANLEFGLGAAQTTDIAGFAGTVDAALVAVAPRLHRPIATQLLEAGIHVLCEKPLAATSVDGDQMVAAAKANRRLLAVGLMTRFHPNNDLLRRILADGMLGEIREITAEYGTSLSWSMTSDAYYNRQTTAGGVFYDSGIHVLDRTLWLFGPLRDIEYQDDSYGGVESNAVLAGKLDVSGKEVPCRMAFSWTHRLSNSIRVIGSQATAEAKVSEPETITVHKRLGGKKIEQIVRDPAIGPGRDSLQVFRDQWSDFAHAIRENREPFVTGASAVLALKLVEQAYAARKRIPQPWVEPEAFAL